MATLARRRPVRALVRAGVAVSIVAVYLRYAADGLWMHFAADDPMNLYTYWKMGIPDVLRHCVVFFDGAYRPLGGLFYLPLYEWAGLNPLPYRVVLVGTMAVNLLLAYRFARALGASERAGALTSLGMVGHSGLADLLYQTSVLYDIFCFTFLLLSLTVYAHIRSSGRRPGIAGSALILALYVAAMDAKEMAYTFPALIFAYEWLYHRPRVRRIADLWHWVVGDGRLVAVSLAFTVAALLSKLIGPNALAAQASYRPVLSMERWFTSNVAYTNGIFSQFGWFTPLRVVALWIGLAYLAWRRPKPHLQFAFVFIMMSTLPISFVVLRGACCLYIPLFGWALAGAVVVDDAIEAASAAPWFRRRRAIAAFALTLLVVIGYVRWTERHMRNVAQSYRAIQSRTWDVIQALERAPLRPARGSKVMFLNDPFPVDYDLFFIATLVWNDPSVEIHTLNREPEPQSVNLAVFDYLMRFDDRRQLQIVKSPTP